MSKGQCNFLVTNADTVNDEKNLTCGVELISKILNKTHLISTLEATKG